MSEINTNANVSTSDRH